MIMSEKFQNKYRIKSARLGGYDYRNEGLYFVTICTKDRIKYFGECIEHVLQLNEFGLIAQNYWIEIPLHFPNVSLGEFVIMPNHIHGIICINEKIIVERNSASVETHNYASLQNTFQKKIKYFQNLSAPSKSLSTILRAYKSAVTKELIEFAWQSRFHDHIIRDLNSFQNIQKYILNNPQNWKDDELFR